MINCLLVSGSKTVGGFEYFLRIPSGGLASIAGNADRTICDIKIIDLVAVQRKAVKYFTKYITRNRFDVIGFSSMIFQYSEILELAKITKAVSPGSTTILGGYYPTVNYSGMPAGELKFFDFIIRGEGEKAFALLIEALNNKTGYSTIPNLSYRRESEFIHNECGPLIDLNTLKLPDRSCRVLKKGFYYLNNRVESIETSRGCTYNCSFCSITRMYGRSYRQFPIERIIEDIKDARNRGAKAVFFIDDNITINTKHLEDLCNAIIANKLDRIKYFMQASVKGLYENPHLYNLLGRAGFESVFIGIEADENDILGFFNKENQFDITKVEKVINGLKNENIFVLGGFIFGLPDDDREKMLKRYEYSKSIGLDFIIFNSLTPYPGTQLREELIAGNYISNLSDYSKYDCYHMNVRTKHLGTKELFAIFDSIIHSYTVDSKAIYRIIKRFPLFFIKASVKFLFLHPDMVFHHLTQGRFLDKERFNRTETEWGN